MKTPVKVLWTGGWDSTYRMLTLLLIQKKIVQPYYVVSRSRQSSNMEIKTMEKIKSLIFQKDPTTKPLLLPTIFKERDHIKPDGAITRKYENLLKMHPLGDQYEYLARFAEEDSIDGMELSIHQDDKARTFIEQYVVGEDEKENYILTDASLQTDLSLFKYFRFPILNLTKLEMQEKATRNNFLDIMNQTWFCHAPINNKPCGVCNPCATTIQEGLRRRIPMISQLRNLYHCTFKSAAKQLIKPGKKQVASDIV